MNHVSRIVMLSSTALFVAAQPSNPSIDVQRLSGEDVVFGDCGTDFEMVPNKGGSRILILSYAVSTQIARIRINGKLFDLRQLEDRNIAPAKQGGESHRFVWASADVRVEVLCRPVPLTAEQSPKDPDSVESTHYSGTMIVSFGKLIRRFKVVGESGC